MLEFLRSTANCETFSKAMGLKLSFSPGKPLVVMYGTEIVVRVRNHQLLNSLSVRIHGLDNEWYQDGEVGKRHFKKPCFLGISPAVPNSCQIRVCLSLQGQSSRDNDPQVIRRRSDSQHSVNSELPSLFTILSGCIGCVKIIQQFKQFFGDRGCEEEERAFGVSPRSIG